MAHPGLSEATSAQAISRSVIQYSQSLFLPFQFSHQCKTRIIKYIYIDRLQPIANTGLEEAIACIGLRPRTTSFPEAIVVVVVKVMLR